MPPIAPHEALGLDAFEQQLQPRAVDLLRVHALPVADEHARLQPLGPHAPAAVVEVQHLNTYRSPPVGFALEAYTRQRIQVVGGLNDYHYTVAAPALLAIMTHASDPSSWKVWNDSKPARRHQCSKSARG